MSIVSEILIANLPAKRKTTPSGWISFNAVCCVHNGNTLDKRQRGGVLEKDDVISYHCFNCHFKASWQPGRALSYKMRKLLTWLHVPDDQINKLSLQIMQTNAGVEVLAPLIALPTFEVTTMPVDSICLNNYTGEITTHIEHALRYMYDRNLSFDDGKFYWSPSVAYRERLIIPFYYNNTTVGWTARHLGDGKPKYLTESQPGFVFNIDKQLDKNEFVIVTEGPMDALPIGGVALLGSEFNSQQAMLINRLNKEAILVPDRDQAGKSLIEPAIEQGWSVSMPDWDPDVKDTGDAIKRYGRLYTLYSIVNAAQQSPLKIRLKEKKWFKKNIEKF
jgi:hypothetical protein